MPVVSSAQAFDGPVQIDGRRMVIERHQCSDGNERRFIYYALPDADIAPATQARVAVVNAAMADDEAASNMDRDAAPALAEMTVDQLLLKVREVYRASDRADTCKIAWWLLRRIANGNVTDVQCRTAFNVGATAWNNFKTNTLTPQSNAWASVITATGS